MKHSKLRGLPGKELKCRVNETRARHARGSVPKKLCQRHSPHHHATAAGTTLTSAAGSAVSWAKFKSGSPLHPTIVIWHRPLKTCHRHKYGPMAECSPSMCEAPVWVPSTEKEKEV